MLAIVCHIRPVAGLLILTEDQPHAAAQWHARVLQLLHRKQRRHDGTLVVHRAASVEPVAAGLAPGGVGPAVADGDDVEVSEDTHDLLPLADLRPRDLAAAVLRADAELGAEREHIIQRLRGAAAVGLAFAGVEHRHTVDRQQAQQRVQKTFLIHVSHS